MFRFDCRACQHNPAYKKEWGCIKPVEEQAVWIDDETDQDFYSCPMLWVSQNITDWYSEYAYIRKHPHTAKEYKTINAKYAQASSVYESAYDFFHKLKNPPKKVKK
jgi:hypothetical protein